ncbi:MAG: DUF3826 domain-containing protein [Bacteroidales bacterium]|nr:DUF3826 domain-containing protein [Bacteroidales bacterium]
MKQLSILIFCIVPLFSYSQNKEADEFTQILTTRSQKIINQLNLKDQSIYDIVTNIMVTQYKNLAEIHDSSKALKENLKDKIKDKKQLDGEMKNLENEKTSQLFNLHCSFIGSLSAYLTNDQIEKIKDGMTYGVVQVTYQSYLDMIPTLKDNEKKQLYAWLVEAREHAMNESSSRDKHAWFGKYKGRFNNYLSKQGYDIQAERKAWEERLKNK